MPTQSKRTSMPKEGKSPLDPIQPQSAKVRSPALGEKKDERPTDEILAAEYTHLISLYTHTENTLFSIFNFYVTLLTTITGAIILLTQIFPAAQINLQPAILLMLVFIILLGLIVQDALLHKNGDLAHFTLAINTLKSMLAQANPKLQRQLFFLTNPHAPVSPIKVQPTFDERLDKYLWWMRPIGMPQLFVSIVNSLALTAIMVLMATMVAVERVPPWKLALGGAVVLGFTFIAHCTYSNMKFRLFIRRAATTLDGEPYHWN